MTNGTCGEDSDCPADQTCLVDLDRATSYCTARCQDAGDCPAFQECRIAEPSVIGGEQLEVRICVDLVRTCGDTELCNGLDDDCDGVVDGPDCELITQCLDDMPCGAWVCQAPENQPLAVCAPPLDGGANDFARCTADSECFNGVCESGFCSELCRPLDSAACRAISVSGELYNTTCARAVGDPSRPRHNKCQVSCTTDTQCPQDLACAWRDVHQGGDAHMWACGLLDPARKPLGAECTNNDPEVGDDECQRGLCYGKVCTRSCGGFGSTCADVGPNFECRQVELFYGTQVFGAFICVEDN